MNYVKHTKDLFQSSNFSRNEINLFSVDFISRLNTIKDPLLPSTEIAKLTTLHQTFASNYGALATTGAVQKGETITRQDAYDDILDFIKRQEGAIKSKFGKGSANYIQFYPLGVTEYYGSTVEGIKVLLVRYVAAAQKFENELGKDFVKTITDLQTAYTSARDNQVALKSGNKSAQTELRESRKALTLQLSKCLLIIAANSLEDEKTFLSYFNFGLLEVDDNNPSEEKEEPPIV